MLNNMNAQLRSLRSRNKAARERERRQNNVSSKKKVVDSSFEALVKEIAEEKAKVREVHDKYRKELAKQGIDADFDDFDIREVLGIPDMDSYVTKSGPGESSSSSKATSELVSTGSKPHPKSTPGVDDVDGKKMEESQSLSSGL